MARKSRIFLLTGLIFVAGFFILGSINPSIELSGEVEIEQPVKEVFSAMVVPLQIKQWLPNLKEVKPIHGKLDTLGNQFLVRVHLGRKPLSFLMDVINFQVNEKVSIVLHLPDMDGRILILCTDLGNRTIVQVNAVLTGKGLFRRSIMTVLKPELKHRMIKSLDALKYYLEIDYKE